MGKKNLRGSDIPEALQKHWSLHGARLEKKGTYRGNDYWIGLGYHEDANPNTIEKGDEWMLKGYYVAVFAIQRDRAILGYPCYFEKNHDPQWTNDQRKKSRILAAEAEAKQAIDLMVESGLLSEYKSGILTPTNIRVH